MIFSINESSKKEKKTKTIHLSAEAKKNYDKNIADIDANAKSLEFATKHFKGKKSRVIGTALKITDDETNDADIFHKSNIIDSKIIKGGSSKTIITANKKKKTKYEKEKSSAIVSDKNTAIATKNSYLGAKSTSITANKSKKSKIREDIDMEAIKRNYRSPEYNKLVGEFFDISDRDTRLILTAIDEDDQDKVLMSLTGKIYNNMIDRVDDIDFGDIPYTKGDITELPNYKKLTESLGLMTELMDRFKESKDTIDVVKEALNNVQARTATWKKGFALNLELPMVTYNTIVLAIIETTGFLISMCVEFIKSPSQDTFTILVDKSRANKSKSHLLLDNLKKFNNACKSGVVDNTMDYIIKSNTKNFAGFATGTTAVFGVVGIAGLLLVLIPILRELIFLYYYQRVKVSDYFESQADILEMNAYNVQNNNMNLTKEERKNISNKQMAIATKFRKISDKIAIDAKASETKATKDISESNKKYKADEVMDEVPDSATAALF